MHIHRELDFRIVLKFLKISSRKQAVNFKFLYKIAGSDMVERIVRVLIYCQSKLDRECYYRIVKIK